MASPIFLPVLSRLLTGMADTFGSRDQGAFSCEGVRITNGLLLLNLQTGSEIRLSEREIATKRENRESADGVGNPSERA